MAQANRILETRLALPAPYTEHSLFNFDKFLGDGWWLAVNQIDFQTALKLTEALEDIPASQPLVQWIRKHAKEDTYLNVLGV